MAQVRTYEQSLAICSRCDYCGLGTDCTTYEERNGQQVAVMDYRKAPSPDCPRCGGPMDPSLVKAFADKMALKASNDYGPGVGRIVEVPSRRKVEDDDDTST